MTIGLAIWVFILVAPALALASTISTTGTTATGRDVRPEARTYAATGVRPTAP